jgi:hypothetical protein
MATRVAATCTTHSIFIIKGTLTRLYAFVGFFTEYNKQWSSSMYVFPHKMLYILYIYSYCYVLLLLLCSFVSLSIILITMYVPFCVF